METQGFTGKSPNLEKNNGQLGQQTPEYLHKYDMIFQL